jgi:hypothetical protein
MHSRSRFNNLERFTINFQIFGSLQEQLERKRNQVRLYQWGMKLNWDFILSKDGKGQLKQPSSTRNELSGELERI